MGAERLFSFIIVSFLLIGSISMVLPSGAEEDGRALDKAIVFSTAGVDKSMTTVIPRGSTVTQATMNIKGMGFEETNAKYDYSDRGNSVAWFGLSFDDPVSATPSNYEDSPYQAEDYDAVSSSDDSQMDPGGWGSVDGLPRTMFHYYMFHVAEEETNEIKVHWEGWGIHHEGLNDKYEARVHIYDFANSQWVKVGEYKDLTGDQVIEKTISITDEDFIDTGNYVHVIAQNKIDGGRCITDYVYIDLKTANLPLDPALDVGDDGDEEWSFVGKFSGSENVDFMTELQEHIDDAGHGQGDVTIVFAFSSESKGKLEVHDLTIVYNEPVAPAWKLIGDLELSEDDPAGEGDDLLDLYDHVTDDRPLEELIFEVGYEQDDTKVDATMDADGRHVDFTVAENWWGTMDFKVKATDIDTLETESRSFTVEVLSVNDPPVIDPVGAQRATAGVPFDLVVTATDPDTELDPTETITFSDDCDLFDIDPVAGTIGFTALKEDVAQYVVTITATDSAGDTGRAVFGLTVEPYDGSGNTAPVLKAIEDQVVDEDTELTLTVMASDAETVYGDVLTFSDDTDIFDIDPATGEISFTPVQEDVGIHEIVITVTDVAGESDSGNMHLTVRNVNDPPTIEPIEDRTIMEDDTMIINVTADDPDIGYDEDEMLIFSDDSPVFDVDSGKGLGSGLIGFTAGPTDAGVYTIRITVTDSYSDKAETTFELEIIDVNHGPDIIGFEMPPAGEIFQGKSAIIKANATDADGDDLTYEWTTMKGKVIGTGDTLDTKKLKAGKHTIKCTVSDGELNDTETVMFKVKPAKDGGMIPAYDAPSTMAAVTIGGLLFALFWRRDQRH